MTGAGLRAIAEALGVRFSCSDGEVSFIAPEGNSEALSKILKANLQSLAAALELRAVQQRKRGFSVLWADPLGQAAVVEVDGSCWETWLVLVESPEWHCRLLRVVGDGEELLQVLQRIANGQPISRIAADGRPMEPTVPSERLIRIARRYLKNRRADGLMPGRALVLQSTEDPMELLRWFVGEERTPGPNRDAGSRGSKQRAAEPGPVGESRES